MLTFLHLNSFLFVLLFFNHLSVFLLFFLLKQRLVSLKKGTLDVDSNWEGIDEEKA